MRTSTTLSPTRAPTGVDGSDVWQRLVDRSVLVRDCSSWPRLDGCLRVTIGTPDDGVGVDPKDLPFLFDRFRQADGSTTRAHRGAGIGLTLAKAFVELHGGTISVESAPGRGAVFTVRIPVRPSGEAKLAQA